MAEDSKPKKGYAAPLEGVVGKEIMSVLNLAFITIGLGMLQSLALKAGAHMGATTATPAAAPAQSAPPSAAAMPSMHSRFSAPRPREETLH